MKVWLRKLSVILIAIMTLGIYVPTAHLNTEADGANEAVSTPSEADSDDTIAVDVSEPSEVDEATSLMHRITGKAKEQTFMKLGTRISDQIDAEFEEDILPKIEASLSMILAEAGNDNLPYYGITEYPSSGFGEKIFNVYDNRTGKDIARFHVRRDNRPLEGYWFNFHYHLHNDGFETHHEIGEIYWDKNIPPKWMS
ncbi:YpjP family protein [Virgibacillus siamensis]|uniref:YpjP family protein n=1 Tax=Virgibacillus siamensis TaxID=480071 RepID=UPI000985965A|nr:YpjP family protein [Virgibacillus siamensis]